MDRSITHVSAASAKQLFVIAAETAALHQFDEIAM